MPRFLDGVIERRDYRADMAVESTRLTSGLLPLTPFAKIILRRPLKRRVRQWVRIHRFFEPPLGLFRSVDAPMLAQVVEIRFHCGFDRIALDGAYRGTSVLF